MYLRDRVRNGRHITGMGVNPCPDCQTMMKIPSILHSNAAHKGGVSEENKLGMEVFGGQSNTTTGTSANVEKGQKANVGGRGR